MTTKNGNLRNVMILVAALVGMRLHAQTLSPADYEKVLIPVAWPTIIAGAFGSQWAPDLWVENRSERKLLNGADIVSFPVFCLFECNYEQFNIEPRTLRAGMFPDVHDPDTTRPTPGFLYVRREIANDVVFSLRINEVSGRFLHLFPFVELPVVRERDLITDALTIVRVPIGVPNYRSRLRIYDFDARTRSEVLLTIENAFGKTERRVTLESQNRPSETFPRQPGYAEIELSAANFPELKTPSGYIISMRPLTPQLRYWAYVTVINNETQQVHLFTPLR